MEWLILGEGGSFNFFRLNLYTMICTDLRSTVCWVLTKASSHALHIPNKTLTAHFQYPRKSPCILSQPVLSLQRQPLLWFFSPLISFMEWLVFWTPEQMKYLVVQAAYSHTSEHQSYKETKGSSWQALGTLTHGSARPLIFWASVSLTKSW